MTIEMVCPACQRDEVVTRVDADPPLATVMELLCPDCREPTDRGEDIAYYDAAGERIFFDAQGVRG